MTIARAKTPIIHPGEVLKDFLSEYGITEYRLAKDIGVDPRRINAIVLGKRNLTADTALRLSKYFGNSAEFWMNAQKTYELAKAQQDLADKIDREVKKMVA